MKSAWTAAVATALSLVCTSAHAQALANAAKRAEESRKTNAATPVAFDERDVNPAIAARELLGYEINQQRWAAYLAADNRVMDAMEKDLSLYSRLETLRATSARMIERFFLREPVLLKALQAAGTDAHEYAYTTVAIGIGMALIANDPGPEAMEQLPEATKTNIAFVRAHEAEIKQLLARGERLRERAAKADGIERTAGGVLGAGGAAAMVKGHAPVAPAMFTFQIDEAKWRRFVTADKLVITVIENSPALYARLKGLNLIAADDPAGVLEQFIAGEPAILKALQTAGTNAREYTYTQLAVTVAAAFTFANPPQELLDSATPAVKANMAFVRAHEREVREQMVRGQALVARMEKR